MIKAIDKWLWPYLRSVLGRPRIVDGPVHVMVALCDHYEPLSPRAGQPTDVGDARVARWLEQWPKLVGDFRGADGCPPKTTLFYPAEEAEQPGRYVPRLLPLVRNGLAEIEIHLHHRNDTAGNLRSTLIEFRDWLHGEHGLLGTDRSGTPRYCFIHGNWALCNSHPSGDWCGVDDEIDVLLETGCVADMTFPSLPSPTQPRHFCNDLYRCRQRGGKPRSHDHGRRARVGNTPAADELLMVQGPVGLNWAWRKLGVIPRIEHADLCASNPPTPARADLWIRQHIHVRGRPEWVFVKLHTHGCLETNADVLLGEPMRRLFRHLGEISGECCVHFVSARELYNIVRAAEDGKKGNPSEYREYELARPAARTD